MVTIAGRRMGTGSSSICVDHAAQLPNTEEQPNPKDQTSSSIPRDSSKPRWDGMGAMRCDAVRQSAVRRKPVGFARRGGPETQRITAICLESGEQDLVEEAEDRSGSGGSRIKRGENKRDH
jgi:hypothetical protein